MTKPVQAAAQAGRRKVHLRKETIRGRLPAFFPGKFKPADSLCELLPLVVVENGNGAETAGAGEVTVDLDGSPNLPTQ